MANAEKILALYQEACKLHQYFLNWRSKLLAGYIVIISAIAWFIFTWVLNTENYSSIRYVYCCLAGTAVTIIFFFLNLRVSELIWRCQNEAYLIEKKLMSDSNNTLTTDRRGVYGSILNPAVLESLDKGMDCENGLRKNPFSLFNPIHHFGALNLVFLVVFVGQLSMLIGILV